VAQNSAIEWTEATWNPTTGCTKVSLGCANCYAERMAFRLKAMEQPRYANGFTLTLQEDIVELPLKWKKPRIIFVNSMSDLFHKDVPDEFIIRCFKVMTEASQHKFQVLTKQPGRAAELAANIEWSDNIWMGTSVENSKYVSRVRTLQKVPAKVRFLSVEPLLGSIGRLPLKGIHWVIVGGESGPKSRPMKIEWVRKIRDRCVAADVPFFFKQWGAFGDDGVRRSKKANGRQLDGKIWSEMPYEK